MCSKTIVSPATQRAAAIECIGRQIETYSARVWERKPTLKTVWAIEARAAIYGAIQVAYQCGVIDHADRNGLNRAMVVASKGLDIEMTKCEQCHGYLPCDMTRVVGDAIDLCDGCCKANDTNR